MSKLDVFLSVSVKYVHFDTFFFKPMYSDVATPKDSQFFGISKEITHRGKCVKIELLEGVPDKSKNVECSICKKKFFNIQELGVHKLICSQDHPQYATAEINKHFAPSRSREKAEPVVEKIQSVVNYLVETVAIDDQGKEVKDKKKATRGSNVRKKHSAVFKAKVIHQVQPDVSHDQIAQKYEISQSLDSKWLKDSCSRR